MGTHRSRRPEPVEGRTRQETDHGHPPSHGALSLSKGGQQTRTQALTGHGALSPSKGEQGAQTTLVRKPNHTTENG